MQAKMDSPEKTAAPEAKVVLDKTCHRLHKINLAYVNAPQDPQDQPAAQETRAQRDMEAKRVNLALQEKLDPEDHSESQALRVLLDFQEDLATRENQANTYQETHLQALQVAKARLDHLVHQDLRAKRGSLENLDRQDHKEIREILGRMESLDSRVPPVLREEQEQSVLAITARSQGHHPATKKKEASREFDDYEHEMPSSRLVYSAGIFYLISFTSQHIFNNIHKILNKSSLTM